MIVCHQCGNKILTFSNINKIRCPKCRAEYITKSQESSTAENLTSKPPINEPEKREENYFDKTLIRPIEPIKPPDRPKETIKIGLKFWGTFELAFLEQIKRGSNTPIYQGQIKQKSKINNNSGNQGVFYFPKNDVLIGRKPSQLQGYEDVDIKMESQDSSISRRQCYIQTIITDPIPKVMISTHPTASNLIEINGTIVEKGSKKQVNQGDFIRFGNSIFEICFEPPTQSNSDPNKTVVYHNY